MPDEKKGWFENRVKRFTVYGAAFLMLLAVGSGVGVVTKKAWAVAQRAEVYIGLPDWLESVDSQVKENGRKLDTLDGKVSDLMHMLEHRGRERSGDAAESPTTD